MGEERDSRACSRRAACGEGRGADQARELRVRGRGGGGLLVLRGGGLSSPTTNQAEAARFIEAKESVGGLVRIRTRLLP